MGSCEDGKFDLLGVVLHWRSREEAMIVRQSGDEERDNDGGRTWENYTVVACGWQARENDIHAA